MTHTDRRLYIIYAVIAFSLITAAAFSKLLYPLHRDAALFLWYSLNISEGKQLYEDLWDIKQPAIFAVFSLAGKIFGFTMVGMRLFEMLWMLMLAAFVTIAFRRYFHHQFLAAFAAIAFVVPYYVNGDPPRYLQVESWAWLPVVVMTWLLLRGIESRSSPAGWLLAAGALAGCVTLFKHVFAPIPVLMVLVASWLLYQRRSPGGLRMVVLEAWVPFAVGVIAVWAMVLAVFFLSGSLDAFVDANFSHTMTSLVEGQGAPWSRLAFTGVFLFLSLAPFLVLAILGLVFRAQPPAGDGALVRLMLAWLAAGLVVVLVQRLGWWTYRSLVLYPPIGFLAAVGVDTMLLRIEKAIGNGAGTPAIQRGVAVGVTLPVILALAYPIGRDVYTMYSEINAPGGSIESYRRTLTRSYAAGAEAADYLISQNYRGEILVVGDPIIHVLTGNAQALRLHTQTTSMLLPADWRYVYDRVQEEPPGFVYIENASAAAVRRDGGRFQQLLECRYSVAAALSGGVWLRRNDDRRAACPSGDGS